MSKIKSDASASRRDIISGVAVAAAIGAVASKADAQQAAAAAPAAPAAGLGGGGTGPVFWTVETTNGKVSGFANAGSATGVKTFLGIPYGASTGGLNRYMPPKKPAKWAGVKECYGYAHVSPQTQSSMASDYSMMIMWDRHVGTGGMGEDCLNLNVWTPAADAAKRPVLVSFHGGGWTTGSGNGPMYDGGQMARLNNVVVVTVNHRLAANGYLHMTDFGAPAAFADAGNVGLLDMVASLEWVRDNIERVGGDKNRVMIFGQSGGGSKTSTLLATPSAKGLFQRAAVQSGSTIRSRTREAAAQDTEAFLKTLGITKATIGNLQKLTWQQILEAQVKTTGAAFSPVVDGRALPHHPFDPGAPTESADVPVIISTTLHDAALRLTNFDMTQAQLAAAFNERYGARGPAILAAYKAKNSTQTPYLTNAEAMTDATRGNSMIQAERKAALNKAPAYMYVWDWANPSFNGKHGAVHGHDVDASFHLYRNPMCGSGSADGRLMADRTAAVWAAFAATGNPNNPLIPDWPAYNSTTRATMVFDKTMRVENNYRGDMVRMIAQAVPTAPRPSFV